MKTRLNKTEFDAAITALGVSQAEAARRVGVQPPVLCQWRSGKHGPTVAHAVRLASVLGVEFSRLWQVVP